MKDYRMFKIASTESVRQIEAEVDANGISYDTLMQRAGKALAERALSHLKHIEKPQITILVGDGNNGGDGLVAGLFIAQTNENALVRFYLLNERTDTYATIAKEAGLYVVLSEMDNDKRLLRNMIASSDLVIDALFGIGVRLPIRDEAQRLLRSVNQALNERKNAQPEELVVNPTQTNQIPKAPKIIVLAADIPSGLNADTGELDVNAIHADEVITFITAKHGLFLNKGIESHDQLIIANLGVPEKTSSLKAQSDFIVDAEYVRKLLPDRPYNSHKGTFGRALLVSGSEQYYGAPMLAAEGCYRVGTGLVTVVASHTLVNAIAPQLPEVTWLPLPIESSNVYLEAIPMIQEKLPDYKALVMGSGLGNTPVTQKFISAFFEQVKAYPQLVLDADALNILANQGDWWQSITTPAILTPHPTEMARLCQLSTDEVQANRFGLVREKAKMWNKIILLKGAHTLIASPDGMIAVLPFKTDALAKAGTGDILAGMIGGFIAQGVKSFESAILGAYLHGMAGVLCAEKMNGRAVLARDILNTIGEVFIHLQR
jgi:ADP-dependent NAD(P)H-hydrate dehydratase / NAD(P)H-hydrate epimerase